MIPVIKNPKCVTLLKERKDGVRREKKERKGRRIERISRRSPSSRYACVTYGPRASCLQLPLRITTAAIISLRTTVHGQLTSCWRGNTCLFGLALGSRGGGEGSLDPEVPEEFSAEEHRHGGRLVALTGLQKIGNVTWKSVPAVFGDPDPEQDPLVGIRIWLRIWVRIRLRIWLRILPFSHKCVERTEIMLAK